MKPTLRELQYELYELQLTLKKSNGLYNLRNIFDLCKNQYHDKTLKELTRLENDGNIAQGIIDLGMAITLNKMAIKEGI